MKEQLISRKTAKLAKKKGFNWFCFYYYDDKENLHEPYEENGSSTDVEFRVDLSDLLENNNHYTYRISAPTQALLQKWLRDVHMIHVDPNYNHIKSDGTFYIKYGKIPESCNSKEGFDTYEAALEAGLLEALKLIK